MKTIIIFFFLSFVLIFFYLITMNSKLISDNKALIYEVESYKKQIIKLEEFHAEKAKIAKEVEGVKNNFSEQKNEELNDNLLSAIDFVSERMCKKD